MWFMELVSQCHSCLWDLSRQVQNSTPHTQHGLDGLQLAKPRTNVPTNICLPSFATHSKKTSSTLKIHLRWPFLLDRRFWPSSSRVE